MRVVLVQNVLIPRILLISLDQNVSIHFVNKICIENKRTFWHKKLYMKNCYSSKSLWIFAIFLSDFLSSKCFNSTNFQSILRVKCFNAPKLYTTENVVYNFINEMIILLIKTITVVKLWKKHFNKDLLVTKKDSEDFKNSTKCWICNNTYVDGDVKVRGHCRVTGNYRGSDSCNINVKWNHFRT